jgi:flagellar biosynthesis anti-sigma factor FlgM
MLDIFQPIWKLDDGRRWNAMRVNDSNSREVSPSGAGQTGVGKTQEPTRVERGAGVNSPAKSGRPSDSVQLSNLGSLLQAEDSQSPERAAKIEKLRADVASGNYKLDAKNLATNLVDDTLKHKL